uniref:Cytochrome c oxidase subunit 3 n=1 Tax=Notidobia ciliaris TaxID=446507 RepID=A0A7D6WF93_9NEOP|nr:cytochrome c oxidase subunit III [Notidobia ciliaris]QNV11743.1 cytochrome c oxidase subunit III [Notidobia ciliaris]
MSTTHSNHPFHLVNYSPWPLTSALSAMIMMSGMISWFHQYNSNLLMLGLTLLIISSYQWWRDIIRESTLQGLHTLKVLMGMKMGMILFIISEVFFFLSFFWTFFHSSLSPTLEIGLYWPPIDIIPFNPFQIPLLNTIILLTSGITVSWAHHSILENNLTQSIKNLMITIILGIYFTLLQAYEYYEASFTMTDSVYGSVFFIATGFHGLHVIIGSMFLFVCLLRMINLHFSSNHHYGFEAAAWYWHFVDIVWLFLYISIYWWSY